MEMYSPGQIEKKWQTLWAKKDLYTAGIRDLTDPDSARNPGSTLKPKYYVLVEFPYPSGERLHVGHARSYNALDCLARYKRMKGYNVLFPLGWDAFGLPAENYALKTGIHPSITTKENIAKAKAQAQSWGLSFDWDRQINTTDPAYYRWTQWTFLQFLKKDLAYLAEIPVNWCPKDKINLANEEVIEGKCERCGTKTERRRQKQWLLRITKYADRLIDDLKLVDYEARIAKQQVEWIGKKEGINIDYQIEGLSKRVTVFTTRPETNFGATFVVLAPESPLVQEITTVEFRDQVKAYLRAVQEKSELDRLSESRQKTGVFTGRYALNPLNGLKLPIWVSDFVLASFGTGALVGVPGHDRRDFKFAQAFGLPVRRVIVGDDGDTGEIDELKKVQEASGKLVNSAFLDGLEVGPALTRMIDYLEEKGWGKRTVFYHLRDWVFSRQHYWGEPIPVVYCQNCAQRSKQPGFSIFPSARVPGEGNFQLSIKDGVEYAVVPVPEDQLPVELPYVERYEPSGTGESPLAAVTDWVNVACPECGSAGARRETDTMPNWAGSSWYYLAYLLADQLQSSESKVQNSKFQNIFSENKSILDFWLPVDWYNGGMEHTTLHLLYSRFWHKFLYDLGLVACPEPYAKRTSHGVVLGPDGARMSKSKGNVINPDEIVVKFGADSLRLYEMFMGPFADQVAWNMNGVAGVYRFLNRIFSLFQSDFEAGRLEETGPQGASEGQRKKKTDHRLEVGLARLAQKAASDIESLKFNTAVAAMMEFVNQLSVVREELTEGRQKVDRSVAKGQDDERKPKTDRRPIWDVFLRILAPFAPHLAEELWQKMHNSQLTMDNEENNSQFSLPAQAGIINSQFASVHQQPWPILEIGEEAEEEVVVQVDGKLRDSLKAQNSELRTQSQVQRAALNSEKIKKYLGSKDYKVIFVPGKLINFVTSGKN